MELLCGKVQTYEWGKRTKDCLVAKFYEKQFGENFKSEISFRTYAELWMGTHINGTAEVIRTKTPLSNLLEKEPGKLGMEVSDYFGLKNTLPFLFKVLSIEKALSIQAHPDKKLAENLFKIYPDLYKDSNHKPELVMALTEMEMLCQFRKIEEVLNFSHQYPEFGIALGKEIVEMVERTQNDRKLHLKMMFEALMNQDQTVVEEQIGNLVDRIGKFENKTPEESLILKLHEQFQKDIGLFCVFFLNYVTIKPYESIFLGANEPHAYISGECIECMANSDNVVRSGLTSKYKDVKTLVDMLTYRESYPQIKTGKRVDKHTVMYQPLDPNVSEFILYLTKVPVADPPAALMCSKGASIALVLEGDTTLVSSSGSEKLSVSQGECVFIPANYSVECVENSSECIIVRCCCGITV